jgi:hypothetical protein
MPELSRDSHPAQPIDITMLSAVIAMPALSESEHGDCFKEAPDTPIGNVARMVLAPLYGLAAAAVPNPTVRTAWPHAEQLAQEEAFSVSGHCLYATALHGRQLSLLQMEGAYRGV